MFLQRALAFIVAGLLCCAASRAGEPRRTAPIDFAREIQPILSDNCYHCHGPDAGRRKAEFRLDTLDPKQGPFAPRDGYSILVPGKLDDSVLVMRITSDDPDVHMPPPASNRALTPQQVELVKRWVEQGAKWGKHWSLEVPRRPEVPVLKDGAWPRNPIDNFVGARLEQENLKPSPQASKETLIRRVSLDLTGLPPTPSEVDAFVADLSPDAYEKLVDRLLESPRYGERMVWEWLDAARYADTNGYQGDAVRTMWPWRDWAVRGMNANMPYDQFVIKQLAGDLLLSPTRDDRVATGFLRNHMINGEGGRIAEENRVDYIMDQTETVSTTFLGLTVGCARCHDHKYDPIKQTDYYSLFAFFNNTPVDGHGGSGQNPPVIDFATAEQNQKLGELNTSLKKVSEEVLAMEKSVFPLPPAATQPTASTRASTAPSSTKPAAVPRVLTAADSPAAAGLSGNIIEALRTRPENRANQFLIEIGNHYRESNPAYAELIGRLKKAIDERNKFNESIPRVMVMQELPKPRDAFVLTKGSYDKPAAKVTARTPSTLPSLPENAKPDRLALARWLFSPEHPLTARVTVNRYWQQFFGVGIVKTVDDFGVQGERPSHPELLDWLAVEFRESGWDVKHMDRLIVTSATYRQASNLTPESFERDPENRLLARGPRFRLPAYMIRDQALFASGLMVEKVGGPPVKPYQPPGVWEDATFGQIKYEQDHGESLYRRSLYTFWRRIVGPTEFFDSAARQTCSVRPSRTNTPLHAFTTMNDPTFVEAARALAQRILKTPAGEGGKKRIDLAYRLVLSRKPTDKERDVLVNALHRLKEEYGKDEDATAKLLSVGESKRDETIDPTEHAAYTALCLEILNLDEAVTKE
jgi:hypothetical protein